jgi:hypothetical protein
MDSKIASKYILKKLVDDFKIPQDIPNQEYLETKVDMLNRMSAIYKSQSRNPQYSARQRARARDLEHNCLGLINGIKFGISFWLHADVDLMKMEPAPTVK